MKVLAEADVTAFADDRKLPCCGAAGDIDDDFRFRIAFDDPVRAVEGDSGQFS